jgi:thiamine pyrophosphate-dependent acetolactate synthase large subunit-like protein
MAPSMTTVAEVIVGRLLEARVSAIFGMPGGGSNLDFIDAAARADLPFVLTATEAGAALAAVAQAEISGRPGACLTTLGPGVASAVNGVACAYWIGRRCWCSRTVIPRQRMDSSINVWIIARLCRP